MTTAKGNLLHFQPDLIQPTQVKGTGTAAENVSLGITMREDKPYLRWVIGNEVARQIGVRAGSRVNFGISEDGQTAVIAPGGDNGWKLVRQSRDSLTVMVIAEKLNQTGLTQHPLEQVNFIRFDKQLIVDITEATAQGA